jgi:hypothetical protein
MRKFLAICGAAWCLLPAQAGASDVLTSILPKKDGAKVCFSRVYDAAHLSKHKDQRVVEMGFRLAFVVQKNDDGSTYASWRYALDAKRRGDGEAAVATGECGEDAGRSFCGVECDGGGVYVLPQPDGSLLVEFGDSRGIRMTAGCGEDEDDFVMLEPGKDDKSFRLARVPDAQCPAYADW